MLVFATASGGRVSLKNVGRPLEGLPDRFWESVVEEEGRVLYSEIYFRGVGSQV
jgi:hypothetical protein